MNFGVGRAGKIDHRRNQATEKRIISNTNEYIVIARSDFCKLVLNTIPHAGIEIRDLNCFVPHSVCRYFRYNATEWTSNTSKTSTDRRQINIETKQANGLEICGMRGKVLAEYENEFIETPSI